MKKAVLCLAALLGAGTLHAAAAVFNADFSDPKWQHSTAWKLSGDAATGRQQPNGYPFIGYRLQFAENTDYKISFQYRCSNFESPENRLVLSVGDRQEAAFPCEKENSLAVAYVRLEKPADRFKLQLQGPEAFQVELKELCIVSLDDRDLSKIAVDFDTDGGAVPSFFRKHDWSNPGRLAVVPAEEHIEGGRAMRVEPGTDKGNYPVYSLPLPMKPEKKYKLAFWGRAEKATGIRLGMDGYLNGQTRHWYKTEAFRLDPEWREYSMVFDSPNLNEFPHMSKGNAYLNIGVTGGPAVELKLITLEILP